MSATSPDLDKLTLIVDGYDFSLWTSATVAAEFLQPCQTINLAIGADETRLDLIQAVQPGKKFQLDVNGSPVCTGFIDSVGAESNHGGTVVHVSGRDMLAPLVDGNVNPFMPLAKTATMKDVVEEVVVRQFGMDLVILDDESPSKIKDAHDKGVGSTVGSVLRPRFKHRPRDPLRDVRPHANQGAYQYLSGIIHRLGYHLWNSADGNFIVLSSPDYEQDPAYSLRNHAGPSGVSRSNNIESAKVSRNMTGVPSHVWVSGKSSKPGDKSSPKGHTTYPAQRVFKPFYVVDDQSNDKDHADTVARFVLGKALLNSFTYEVTLRGFSDPSGSIYAVNTVANVKDERCGLDGLMWVSKRTFRKSRQGTFTDLTLIPVKWFTPYLLQDSPPPPAPKDYTAARADQKIELDKLGLNISPLWFHW